MKAGTLVRGFGKGRHVYVIMATPTHIALRLKNIANISHCEGVNEF